MNARERLRAYLEQRRELGESELYLDELSVDEALAAIGAIRRAPVHAAAPLVADHAPVVLPPRQVAVEEAPTQELPVKQPPPVATAIRKEPNAKSVITPVAKDMALPLPVASNEESVEVKSIQQLRSIAAVNEMVAGCTRCELYQTATNAVPGEGSLSAELMCVGEAPGANEDATGRPFVGAAGKLMDKILAAIDLTREEVYICNVLKHRPPGNRNPLPHEVAACSPYLVKQIQLIKPKVIVAWGTFAAQTLLQTKTPIGKLRGTVHEYLGVPLIVTYHPAALLRNPAWKRPTWEDVQLARRVLDSAR